MRHALLQGVTTLLLLTGSLAACGGSGPSGDDAHGPATPGQPAGAVLYTDPKGRFTVSVDPAWRSRWDRPGSTGLMAWTAAGTTGSFEADSPQLAVFMDGDHTGLSLAEFTTWYATYWQHQGCMTDSTGTVPGLHSAQLGIIECHGTVLSVPDSYLTAVFDLGRSSVAVAEVFTDQATHASARTAAMPYLVTIKDTSRGA